MSAKQPAVFKEEGGTRLAIMQPYFLPHLGYYQLIAAVDILVVYDNIKYTKKGWINRNRLLQNGSSATFSLPLKNGSDFLNICEREISMEFDRSKLLNRLNGAYRRAPYFLETLRLIEEILSFDDRNLFRFLHHSIIKICRYLDIATQIRASSECAIDHRLRSQEKVLALCGAVGASTYVNSIGGIELYSREAFRDAGVSLKFVRSKAFEYAQLGKEFVPNLSIIDVMMFNPLDAVKTVIAGNYELI